ncbi:hypothetical protein ACP70R_022969 [Stipagrostis hirtigluma subsp. patula]
MELRSGRRLGSPRRCRPRRCHDGDRDGDGVDRISGLPDDLLLQVLARLRCARAAARASVLSRRWRGLWSHLPELSFREIAPDALNAALDQVARTDLSLLDISVSKDYRISPAGVASLLRTAARLAPVELGLVVWGYCKDRNIPIEVPCFHRATSIKLDVRNLHLTPPAQAGQLPVLERLSMAGCTFDTGAMVSRCPRLRVLEVLDCWSLGIVKVHSTTIQELAVHGSAWHGGIDIVAPVLKNFTLDTHMGGDFSMSFLAPLVEDLRWSCLCNFVNVDIGQMWRLSTLNLWKKESICRLHMNIQYHEFLPLADRNMMQQIAQILKFSVLALNVTTYGHVFGAMMLSVLEIFATIQCLDLTIEQLETIDEACPEDCPCDRLPEWRNQNISLTALEELNMTNFKGSEHEVDFLKLLLRCAPLMKRVSVKLAPNVIPRNEGCKKICNIFNASPSVKCYVYHSSGKKVVYA